MRSENSNNPVCVVCQSQFNVRRVESAESRDASRERRFNFQYVAILRRRIIFPLEEIERGRQRETGSDRER